MKTLTKEQSGKLIAHWRLMPTDKDVAVVRNIVCDAVINCGMDATIDIAVKPWDIPSLGHGRIEATIKVRNAYDAIRAVDGSLVKGMDTITIWFDACAGLFDFDAYGKRQKEESALFATLAEDKAMEAIDNLPWDGIAVQFSGRTNGKARDYRKRHFYPYEGKGHYGYGGSWADIAEEVEGYIGGIARNLGYAGKLKIRNAA